MAMSSVVRVTVLMVNQTPVLDFVSNNKQRSSASAFINGRIKDLFISYRCINLVLPLFVLSLSLLTSAAPLQKRVDATS